MIKLFKIVLSLFIFINIANATEKNEAETICDTEIEKKVVNKKVLSNECIKAAKYYENKKNYDNASWYYLLGGENNYNINTLYKNSNDYNGTYFYASIGHSYVLKNDILNAKKSYKKFMYYTKLSELNITIKEDYDILFKIYPEQKDLLTKGLKLWSEIYKPYARINDLYIKYKKAEKKQKYKDAINYLSKVIKFQKKYQSKYQLIYTYDNLGFLYDDVNDFSNALKYYNKALLIEENTFGKLHINTATLHNNIGMVYYNMKDNKQALKYIYTALNIVKKEPNNDIIDLATVYNNIAFVYNGVNDFPNALKYYKKAQVISENKFGEEHIDTADIYNNLGTLYLNIGENTKSIYYIEKALKIRENILGEFHKRTMQSYYNLGVYYCKNKKSLKSLNYYKKALSISVKLFGDKHKETLKIRKDIDMLNDLVKVNKQNDTDE